MVDVKSTGWWWRSGAAKVRSAPIVLVLARSAVPTILLLRENLPAGHLIQTSSGVGNFALALLNHINQDLVHP